MAPSSTTPNFSRPLISPLSTGGLDTPARGSRRRDVFEGPPHSATIADRLCRPTPRDLSPTKRLFNTPGGLHASTPESHASPKGRYEAASNSPLPKLNVSISTGFQHPDQSFKLGGVDKPIKTFRPEYWPFLDRQQDVLRIDVFWPIDLTKEKDDDQGKDAEDDDDDDEDFPYDGLKPLVTFHNLRFLQITGMMRSYQPLIFAAVWVNKNLTHLHLEMALEPEMNASAAGSKLKYHHIDTKWSYNPQSKSKQQYNEYLGSHGEGVLHEEFGIGEYLDQQAIRSAHLDVAANLPAENVRFLPITHMTLKNFAVDAGPFSRWFDPKKLREITFLGDCFDVGFYLPDDMKFKVKVNSPKPPAMMVARRVKPGEVKLVEIKGKKSSATGKSDVSKVVGGDVSADLLQLNLGETAQGCACMAKNCKPVLDNAKEIGAEEKDGVAAGEKPVAVKEKDVAATPTKTKK